jgi:hypothetical protein
MATITTGLTFDNTTIQNVKQWTNGISSTVLSLGWVTSGDAGCLSSGVNYGSATITNISATGGVVTITYSSPTNNFAIGSKILIAGVTTNTVLNNQYFVITTIPSTTTFTFAFTGSITNGADTGTATALYNFNTLTNVMDQSFTAAGLNSQQFNTGGPQRFRGAWVAVTPTFTNLQTTNNLTTITFGSPHGLDLTRSLGLALNVSAVANANFTFLNTNPGSTTTGTNGWPITAITALTLIVNTGSSPRADIASTPVSAGVGTPQYNIAASSNLNPDFDTVLYQGDLYGLTAVNTGLANFSGTPGNTPTASPGWRRFLQDMFTSNDALSSTNKLYFKFFYGSNNTAASGIATPILSFSYGSASDGQSNITTNYNWPIVSNTFPSGATGGNSNNSGTAQWESNFSGTAGRLSVIFWRGFTATSAATSAPTTILIVDRSKDNSGNDTDSYWTIAWSGFSSTSNGTSAQQSIQKPGTGGAGIIDWSTTNLLGAIHVINTLNNQESYNNQIPVFPIFPIIGYIGNPLLGGIAMKSGDTSEGALVQVTLYGNTHPFLMTVRGGAQAFGVNNNNAAGIRWE